ncbi:hypothetical protein [Modicisalibacter luteus]|uniref:hypothetical protein n=1 Tax=Modicisalibacter luteus TaxID=453962 RepID=UPI00039B4901
MKLSLRLTRSLGAGRWALGAGRWALGAGRWALGAGRHGAMTVSCSTAFLDSLLGH